MAKNLVIVESPAKAKTIEKFLGKDYTVKSSFGHIRDLVKKDYGIDIENNYKPNYEVMPDKKKVVAELRKQLKTADSVLLASDEDREGEAIAWHLYEVLKLKNKNTKRIVFNEITKTAIKHAVDNPGEINFDLVNAQQARRILDRLVGFQLSAVLWKKVKSQLSAGRVQSVAVKLLVEREREIIKFKAKDNYKVTADFRIPTSGENLPAELNVRFDSEDELTAFLKTCGSKDFSVGNIEKKPSKRMPSAPFTTSSLQQEAGRKLGFPVSKTMRVAQKLYEAGFITYMRTDSVNLSKTALDSAKTSILSEFGEKYYKKRTFKTKAKGAQEAHEAIRPTYLENKTVDAAYDEVRLYELIRKRTLASQMSEALFEKTNIEIKADNCKNHFTASGEVLVFDGFMRIYGMSQTDKKSENGILPRVNQGEKLDLEKIDAVQKFSKHPARYTEPALVRKLEELGIGRPSTYAPTISTVQNRGYVIKEDREGFERQYIHIVYKNGKISKNEKTEIYGAEKSKLFPTDIAMVVTDFLSENFTEILDYNFTAEVEKQFDDIAAGKIAWQTMIDNFYKDFHKQVEETVEHAERNAGERILGIDPETGKQVMVRIARFGPVVQLGEKTETEKPKFANLSKEQHIETITLEEALDLLKNAGGGRLLGKHPDTGENIYARMARFGAVVQMGENEGKEKPKFASLLKGMTLDSVTLDEAVELLRLPRTVGKYEDKVVVAAVGRFGPYVRHDGKFVSLKKTDNPLTIDIDRAVELIEEKRKKDAANLIKTFDNDADMKIMKDRWGRPCIHYKKKYYRLSSKIKEPAKLSYDECMKIIEKELPKTKKTTAKKKVAAKKKTPAKRKTTTAKKKK